MADYVYFSVPSTYTTSTIDTSGVSNPAPQGVYQTIRHRWSDASTIYYYIPNIPSGTKTIRLHFAEIYFNFIGDQVFDIRFNGSVVYSNFDILAQTGGMKNKAYVFEFSASPTPGGAMPIELAPKLGNGGVYNAAINGIEILKP